MEKIIECIYKNGKIEPTKPLNLEENSKFKIIIISNKVDLEKKLELVKRLRGKYKGFLSLSNEFSEKKNEKNKRSHKMLKIVFMNW